MNGKANKVLHASFFRGVTVCEGYFSISSGHFFFAVISFFFYHPHIYTFPQFILHPFFLVQTPTIADTHCKDPSSQYDIDNVQQLSSNFMKETFSPSCPFVLFLIEPSKYGTPFMITDSLTEARGTLNWFTPIA